jgi:hypothetical protein
MGKINLKAGTGKTKAPVNAQEKQTEVLDVLDFGPSLIDGESAADYEAFRQKCLKAIGPKDVLEIVWLQDFIGNEWENLRMRRMKAAILQNSRVAAVKKILWQYADDVYDSNKILKSLGGPSAEDLMAKDWGHSDVEAIDHVDAVLEANGLNFDVIMAETLLDNLNTIERIDKLIAAYVYRRDTAIRELDKRRDLLAKRARDLADSLAIDAEIVEI